MADPDEPEHMEDRAQAPAYLPPEIEALRVISNGYAALPHMFWDERETFLRLVKALCSPTLWARPGEDEPRG